MDRDQCGRRPAALTTQGPLRNGVHGGAEGFYGALVLIRDAVDDDWLLIYPFFARIVAQGKTYAYPEGLGPDEARSWWLEPSPGRTVIALDAGAVLGSAKMGPNRPGRGSHVATASFMVDPHHQRRGVGRALGVHVIDWARAQGYRSIQFNAVVETNAPAVALWHALGFQTLATVPEAFDHPDHGLVGLHIMFLDLSAIGAGTSA
jgi:GNAT superfamily N-acetyltransferase